MKGSTIRWGILATGSIAGVFAEALRESEGAEIVAAGSRSADDASRFADRHGIPRAHGSYADLAADPDVDAVYVATPHAFHERDAILCLEHGKHVLCEKPLAINAEQARRMIDAARAADRLLMEAMWTRFLPSTRRLVEIIASGVIGEPRSFSADFRIAPSFDPTSRLFDPALGGGALLDLGVYAVSMAHHLFGPPESSEGDAVIGPTGVDDESSFSFRHMSGRTSEGRQSLRAASPLEARVTGSLGSVLLHEPWWAAHTLTLRIDGNEPAAEAFDLEGGGYAHMAEAFMDMIRDGRREPDVMTWRGSVEVMESMDALRKEWGFRYPCE